MAVLSPHSASQIVKRYAGLTGFDPAAFAGHSLLAGFLTSAAEAGASVLKMVEVSRHKSIDMLRTCVRRADLFQEHAGSMFLWGRRKRFSYEVMPMRAKPASTA